MEMIKYPRTPHLRGSRLQRGDQDLEVVPVSDLRGKHVVVTEKVDGANTGVRCDSSGSVHLQSRGHFLTGGPREFQFTLLKQWASTHAGCFSTALTDRYVAYGEWFYSKHTVFYDLLPHYWMEFDILDRSRSRPDAPWFLDAPSRLALLQGLPFVPAKTIWAGTWTRGMCPEDFLGRSSFKSPRWRERLRQQVDASGHPFEVIWPHTDPSDAMEGIYLKWEDGGRVMGRYKFVRADFVSLITDHDEHHINLPIVPNVLAEGVNLFSEALGRQT